MTEPQSFQFQDLTDGQLSQLKILAQKQEWSEIVHDCRDEQQTRMPGPEP